MWQKAKFSDQQYDEIVNNPNPALKFLSIFPTLKCDARCKFCHIWGEKGWALQKTKEHIVEQIDIEVLKQFLEDALRNTPDQYFWVLLTGGEPLLYNNIVELFRFLRKKRLPVLMFTNGSHANKYAEDIVQNLTAITFSIDGPPEIHNTLRNINGLFEKACDGIERILDMKKRTGSFFPMVRINYVISQYNLDSIKEFVEAIRERFKSQRVEIQFDAEFIANPNSIIISFESLLFTTSKLGEQYARQMKEHFGLDLTSSWKGFVEDDIAIKTDDVENNLTELWRSSNVDPATFVDLNEYFHNIHNVFGRKRCTTPWNEIMIRQNGEVYFCPLYTDYSLGNIYKSGFNEIWNGETAQAFRRLLSKQLLALCNRCCRLWMDYEFQKLQLPEV